MKRLYVLFVLLFPALLSAQDFSVRYTRKAVPQGSSLSVSDVTTAKGLRPVLKSFSWKQDGSFFYVGEGKEYVFTVIGEESVSDPVSKSVGSLPEKAADINVMGRYTAYTLGHSLYVSDGESSRLVAEGSDDIIYGQSVSRNEFGIDGGIFWSDDASKLAFYRKDESLVTSFPLLNIKTRTGELEAIKYPMNGMQSEKVTLGIFDMASSSVVYVCPDDFGYDRYLTNISWNPSSTRIFIQVLDRSQHHMKLNEYDASDGSFIRTILTEDNDKWVEPYSPLHFIDDETFIYSIDNRDSYKNLYLCRTDGQVRRITCTDADVQYLGMKNGYLYYNSAEVCPVENHVFRVSLSFPKKGGLDKVRIGEPEHLTPEHGWHNVRLSPDGHYFLDSFSAFDVPGVVNLRKTDGSLVRELDKAEDALEQFGNGEIRMGTVKSADGKFDNWYRLFLPKDFDPSKKYPAIVYVYGGPHSQMVQNRWLAGVRYLELYLAQQGYVVYVQDNRGTSNRGAEYEKAINRQCGQAEMEDQMVGVNALMKLPFVDRSRIGVHGWSYGGFMTISLMTNYPEVFKTGVAGGPVIDWKWYEIMYGERYMDTMESNQEGFAKTSLINKASSLEGRLLICQGAIDNTVVWEHSLSFVQECIEKGVLLDFFPYPCSEHNVAGPWRVHLNETIVRYFEDNL